VRLPFKKQMTIASMFTPPGIYTDLPDWFRIGAKVYLYGCTPAYTVTAILESSWYCKDTFGDTCEYPLDEVVSNWSPTNNSDNEPRKPDNKASSTTLSGNKFDFIVEEEQHDHNRR